MPLVRVNERLKCISIKIPPPYGSSAEPVLGMSCKRETCTTSGPKSCTARTEDMSALELLNAIAPRVVTLENGRRVTRFTNPPFIIAGKKEKNDHEG